MILKLLILSSLGFVFGYATNSYNKFCNLPCDFVGHNVTHTVCTRKDVKCGAGPLCGPDFQEIRLSNEDRQYILDLHNYLRNKVALGFESRGDQPPASNMNAINYNSELEYIAQCWVNSCHGYPLDHDLCRRTIEYQHVGQNLGFVNSSTFNINVVSSVKDLILAWYDEVAIYKNDWISDTQDRAAQVGHYTQLIWADSSEIGCALSYYTSNAGGRKWYHILFACNYGPGGNYIGRPVYKIGKPCSKCAKGKPNKKYRGLCGNVYSMDKIPVYNGVYGKK